MALPVAARERFGIWEERNIPDFAVNHERRARISKAGDRGPANTPWCDVRSRAVVGRSDRSDRTRHRKPKPNEHDRELWAQHVYSCSHVETQTTVGSELIAALSSNKPRCPRKPTGPGADTDPR